MAKSPVPPLMTNDQVAEVVRAQVVALRGEMTRRLDDMDRRLDQIVAVLDRLPERGDES